MKIGSRLSFALLSFVFAAGTGAAFAASSTSCIASCNAEIAACLDGVIGSAKAACVAQGKACKKQCAA